MVNFVEQDLLDSKYQYIGHICNCITTDSAGMAKGIFDRFPWANTYQYRSDKSLRSNTGTISVHGNGESERLIINMYSQYYPGGPKSYESREKRLSWLKLCLLEIEKINNIREIAFPYKMGCSLAGGIWQDHLDLISDWSKNNIEVYICDRGNL